MPTIGYSDSIVTFPSDVWDLGGEYPGLFDVSNGVQPLEIVSDNAADTSAGIGARTVRVRGVNAAYSRVDQTITMTGTTPVSIPTSLLRVNEVRVLTAGTNTTNVGRLTVRIRSGGFDVGRIMGVVRADIGRSMMAIQTISEDLDAKQLIGVFCNSGYNADYTALLQVRQPLSGDAWNTEAIITGTSGRLNQFEFPTDGDFALVVAKRWEVRVRISGSSIPGASFSAGFNLIKK